MDVVTQALLGACAAQAIAGRSLPRSAWLVGLVAGWLPDADIVIRPADDPLGGLLWHRHFTHAMLVAPPMALALTGLFALVPSLRRAWRAVFLACLAAILTHAPLDAATSYGTLIWWPFSYERVSWDVLPIIDPLVTFPLIALLAWSVLRGRRSARAASSEGETPATPTTSRTVGVRTIAFVGVLVPVAYAGLGAVQRSAALDLQARLAEARGHEVLPGRVRVMPQPGSQLLWRSIYEYVEPHTDRVRIQTDFLRLPHWPYTAFAEDDRGGPQLLAGRAFDRVERCDILERPDVDLASDDRIGITFERFAWFADGFVAVTSERPLVVGDIRYGIGPDSEPLWGLVVPTFSGAPPNTLRMAGFRDSSRVQELWNALTGRDERMVPIEEAIRAAAQDADQAAAQAADQAASGGP